MERPLCTIASATTSRLYPLTHVIIYIMERLKPILTNGRFIRLAIVSLIGLFLAVYVVQLSGILGSSKSSGIIAPTPIIIPTQSPIQAGNSGYILPGDIVLAQVDGDMRNWQFDGMKGEIIDLLIEPVGTWDEDFDLIVELFTPDGQKLAQLDQAGSGKPESIQGQLLPQDGQYALFVSDKGFDSAGSYQLHFLNDGVKNTYQMRFGINSVIRGDTTIGALQYWVFSGGAGQVVSASLVPYDFYDDRYTPSFLIYAPDGQLVVSANAENPGTPVIRRDITLPVDGTYTVWIGEQGYDDRGRYTFTVQEQGIKSERLLREQRY